MPPDDPERKLDAWLDETLSRYSAVEPRAGLESRVLYRLEAERRRQPRRWWKAWAPALATAAALIIVTLVVIRNRDFTSERVVLSDNPPAQAPSPPQTRSAGQQPKATAGSQNPSRTGESSPEQPSETVQEPERGMARSVLTTTGGNASAKTESRIARDPRRAPAPSPHRGTAFPLPAPLSEQERLALAAAHSGLLSIRPGIPPGEEPLPQVVIDEIEIEPLQGIQTIGGEGL
jgi:hypothetical protein